MQIGGVCFLETCLREILAALSGQLVHRGADVHADGTTVLAHELGHVEGEKTGSGPDVENMFASS